MSVPLLAQVTQTMRRHAMLQAGDAVVLAVSGGPDSVALLHLFHGLQKGWNLRLHVAHLNHCLRGAAADQDAAFVAQMAANLGLPVTIADADVSTWARTHRLSIEQAGRQARYDFLAEVARKQGARRIATGHTANDQAETVLMRLLRGCGITGLGAIRPVRDGWIIRPLIETTRQTLLDWLVAAGIPYREDETNTDPRYLRNRIRSTLMPVLMEQFNPRVVATLGRFAKIARDDDEILKKQAQEAVHRLLEHYLPGLLRLDRQVLQTYPAGLQRRIFRQALASLPDPPDLSWRHLDDLLHLSKATLPAHLQWPGGIRVEVQDAAIYLGRDQSTAVVETPVPVRGLVNIRPLEGKIHTTLLDRDQWGGDFPAPDAPLALFDWAAINGPLLVRTWRAGDRIRPLGLGGARQKLHDFFINRKIPRLGRNRLPLLVCDGEIIWVVGHGRSERAKLTSQTKQILKVSWQWMF